MSHLYKQKAMFWLAYSRHGRLYRESLKTKDKTTAKYLQAKKDQELAEMKAAPTPNTPIDAVIGAYQRAYEHRKTKDNYLDDATRIRRFVTWAGIKTISEITEERLQNYLNYRLQAVDKDKISQVTANNIATNVKAIVNFAVKRRYISTNPLASFAKFKIPQNPPRFLNNKEVGIVLKLAKKTDLYPAVATAIYTGMRKSEIFNLEWSDIDFDRGTITVQNKEGFTTKSKRFRVIPLHPALNAILGRLKHKEGRCFDVINQRRVLTRIFRVAKIKDAGWHTFRHSFASALVVNGVDIVTVSKLLGHSSIITTQIYSHLTGDHIKQAVGKLRF